VTAAPYGGSDATVDALYLSTMFGLEEQCNSLLALGIPMEKVLTSIWVGEYWFFNDP